MLKLWLCISTVTLLQYRDLVSASHSALKLEVTGHKVVEQLLHLATYSVDPAPAVTRVLFTEADTAARRYVKELFQDAGLTIHEDPMGNIFGRWEGTDASAGAVMTGSHCDAIPLAGLYDGTLGVIGGAAAVKALRQAGFKPAKTIEVIMFTSEEPTRFALGCIGSRGLAGTLTAEVLDARPDENGTLFKDAAAQAGYGGESHEAILDGTLLKGKRKVASFVELHIEQGPRLEAEGKAIGIVQAIAAPAAMRVSFHGDGGHAGAQLMPLRNDASLAAAELALEVEAAVLATGAQLMPLRSDARLAAAELALEVEAAVLATGAPDTVGTTGRWELSPNTVNSVPRDAILEIDVRDIDGPRRDQVVTAIHTAAQTIAKKRNVRHKVAMVNQDSPATCGPEVIDAVTASVKELGLSSIPLVSRAYHDSTFMAQIAPTGMIFIPCRNGWSHRPDEFAEPEAIEDGVKVLALTLARLAAPDPTRIKSEL